MTAQSQRPGGTSWHRSPSPGPAAWPGAKLSAQTPLKLGLEERKGYWKELGKNWSTVSRWALSSMAAAGPQ